MKSIKLIEVAKNLKSAYEEVCLPLTEKLNLPLVALDIILFLSNNPEYPTAKDISKYRDIKPNLISLYVDKLVKNGYLLREEMPGDRRQVKLICTKKCEPIVELGRNAQKEFLIKIMTGLTEEEQKILFTCLEKLNENAQNIIKKSEYDLNDESLNYGNNNKGKEV